MTTSSGVVLREEEVLGVDARLRLDAQLKIPGKLSTPIIQTMKGEVVCGLSNHESLWKDDTYMPAASEVLQQRWPCQDLLKPRADFFFL